MKKNKFIPLTVLAGLGFVAIAMNKQQCTQQKSKASSAAAVLCDKNPGSKEKCKHKAKNKKARKVEAKKDK